MEDIRARINRGDIERERHEAINVRLLPLKYTIDADIMLIYNREYVILLQIVLKNWAL